MTDGIIQEVISDYKNKYTTEVDVVLARIEKELVEKIRQMDRETEYRQGRVDRVTIIQSLIGDNPQA